jgi:acetylornithine deacetylase/succinyl-diaminopimelate desuccinylase-like protein
MGRQVAILDKPPPGGAPFSLSRGAGAAMHIAGMSSTKARTSQLEGVFAAVDRSFDVHLETIRRYLRQPSVSATGEGIRDAAELTAELIEGAGGAARLVETDGHPAVVGRIEGAGPSLLRYGMYDVQPVDEPGWDDAPFAATIRDIEGVGPSVVARGAANSKGCLSAFLCALAEARRHGDLPVSITFLIDGEEELGSRNLPDVLERCADELRADAGFDLDLHADISGRPNVYLGCKGVLSIMLTCRGGGWGGPVGRDLHSSYGAVVGSPAWSLVRALNALVGPDEKVRVPLEVPPIPADDEPYVARLAAELDLEGEKRERNARTLKSDSARTLVESLMYGAVLNVNGLEGGAPQGSKTIVPHSVRAALDLRLPYGADMDGAQEAIVTAVHHAAPEVDVDVYEVCPPAKTSPTSTVAAAMIASHSDVGASAQVWPTSPWWAPYYLFETNLGIPFAHGGAGHAAGAHGPNEYASIEGIRAHMKQSLAFLHRYAEACAE